MKGNAIARIIIYAIVLLMLSSIMVVGITIDTLSFDFLSNTREQIEGSGSVDASTFRDLEIDWAVGQIIVQNGETDEIVFTESGIASQKLAYEIQSNKLYISYSKTPIKTDSFTPLGSKDLTIIVPSDWNCDELSINGASADIRIVDLNADEVEINTASGKVQMDNCTFGELNIDTASGQIQYDGILQTLECNAASADFKGIFRNIPKEISMDSASGDLDITLPENCGFQVTVDALRGRFHSDFPATYSGDSYRYGDENCKIEFDGLSGDIIIRNNN